MPAFETRIPRKSASRQSPSTSVSPPKTARMELKTVKTFALTMLAYDRLASGRAGRLPFETTALGLVAAEAGAVGNAHGVTALRGSRAGRDVEAARH